MDPVERTIYLLLAIIPAFTLHELGHALTATLLGDPTPRWRGRLTLNPLAHVDWIGLLLLVTVGFGWAKPVETNPSYYRNRRWGTLLVALAGPMANIILAVAGAIGLVWSRGGPAGPFMIVFVSINIRLALFNLIPVPPLDGSHILASLFPNSFLNSYQARQYGWIVLMLLLVTGLLSQPLWLASTWLERLVFTIGHAIGSLLPAVGGL